MILIADSGSTKTDWCGLKKDVCLRLQTGGINPVLQKPEDIVRQLYKELLPQLPVEPIEAIHFYGAGCTPLWSKVLRTCLMKVFGEQIHCEVHSDMVGAARALCGQQAGIVCILGTGSNSCYYDGQQVTRHTPALGYVLGDEGSGAYLGRQLLNGVLKELLPPHICITFANETQLTQEEIIHKVYRRPLANQGLSPSLGQPLPGQLRTVPGQVSQRTGHSPAPDGCFQRLHQPQSSCLSQGQAGLRRRLCGIPFSG